jgi:hypothetical protein
MSQQPSAYQRESPVLLSFIPLGSLPTFLNLYGGVPPQPASQHKDDCSYMTERGLRLGLLGYPNSRPLFIRQVKFATVFPWCNRPTEDASIVASISPEVARRGGTSWGLQRTPNG